MATAPITYTAAAAPFITVYNWTIPPGWTGSSTSNSITVTPNGTNGGTISVQSVACGGSSAPLSENIALQLSPSTVVAGPSLVCSTGGPYIYTVSNQPAGTTLTWSTSSPTILSIDQSGYASTANNTIGFVSVISRINECNLSTQQNNIWVGKPDRPGSITGNTSPNIGHTEFYFSSGPGDGATSYDWIVPYNSPGCTYCWSYQQNDALSIFAIVGSNPGKVQVVSRNNCGAGAAAILFVTPSGDPGCDPCPRIGASNQQGSTPSVIDSDPPTVSMMTAFPNPANELMTVSLPVRAMRDTPVFLYDMHGKVSLSGVSIKEGEWKTNISTQSLGEGLYVVRVMTGDLISATKVMLVHK